MDRVFIAGLLALLVMVGLIALYAGNNMQPTATYMPATQPKPTAPTP